MGDDHSSPIFLRMKRNIDILIVGLILIGLLLFVYRDIVFSDHVFVKRDIGRYYYPLRRFVADSLREGTIPLWNPYLHCGTPLHATIQSCIFYPLSIIYYFGDVARGLSLFTVFHIFLAGFFTYLFMKSIGASKAGSFLAAFTFMFSGFVIGTICLTIGHSSTAWFPLVMLLFIKGLKERRYRFSILLALATVLMFLAGDPSVAIITFTIMLTVSVYVFIQKFIKERQIDSFILFNLVIVLSLFLLLTAFQTIPAVEFFNETTRSAMAYEESSLWSMPYFHFISFIIPYFNDINLFYKDFWVGQRWLDNYYVGIITLILAGFALRFGLKRRIVRFLLAIGIFSVAISLGRHFVAYPLLYRFIPFFRMVRYPVRFFFIFTFSICALAGMGYDYLKESLDAGRLKRLTKIFLMIGCASALVAISLNFLHERISPLVIERATKAFESDPTFSIGHFPSIVNADFFNFRRTLLYISMFGVFIFLWRLTKYKRLMPLTVFLVIGFDMILTNTGYEPTVQREYFIEATENVKYVMEDKDRFRVFASPYAYDRYTFLRNQTIYSGIGSTKDLLVNNRMMEFGIYDMGGYGSTSLRRNSAVSNLIFGADGPAETNLLDLLNVKYISSHSKLVAPGYEKVSETEHGTIYLNSGWLPRALILRDVKVMDDDDILEYMASKEFAPGREVILEESPEKTFTRLKHYSGDSAKIIRYEPQLVEIETSVEAPAMLLLSDTYYPGWKVFVDDEEVKIFRADYFLRAVEVPKGIHSVRFIYDPLSFKLGLIISLSALLYLSVWLFFRQLRLTKSDF